MHNDYPFAPEKLEISKNMLLNYCRTIANKYHIKISVNRLVPPLVNKNKHILHYRNLQLYLLLGTKLTKVQRILKFKQSDWLKKYIDFKTNKRKHVDNIFEKDFFKLMKNSVL